MEDCYLVLHSLVCRYLMIHVQGHTASVSHTSQSWPASTYRYAPASTLKLTSCLFDHHVRSDIVESAPRRCEAG